MYLINVDARIIINRGTIISLKDDHPENDCHCYDPYSRLKMGVDPTGVVWSSLFPKANPRRVEK